MKDFKLLINGVLTEGASEMNVLNPATEDVLAVCPRSDEAQLNEAVAAAKAAFPGWAATPIEVRRKMLVSLADALQARFGEFVRLLTQEQGKPLQEAEAEVGGAEAFLRYFASLDLPSKLVEETDERKIEELRKPLGVVAAITPWNYPLLILMFKLPPALLAGNTLVCKPAPTTPLTTLRIGELCADIFPAGVVNIITDQNDLGGLLSLHPDIAKVSFTGSTATGKKVMESAATTLKRITLELGGNDAGIVLDDVDPKVMAPKIFDGAFTNAGQVCLAIKRLYVHESIYDEMCEELIKLAREAVVDDGLKQGTRIGPLQNRKQYERVKGLLEQTKAAGARMDGGEIDDRPGYFIAPTIVRGITDGAPLVDEEQFGPVLPVMSYSDIDDVVGRVNASPYGLGGSIWATDTSRARTVAERIESGTVWINQHIDMLPHVPFGGSKQSGMGVEFGQEGLEEFTQGRIINMAK